MTDSSDPEFRKRQLIARSLFGLTPAERDELADLLLNRRDLIEGA